MGTCVFRVRWIREALLTSLENPDPDGTATFVVELLVIMTTITHSKMSTMKTIRAFAFILNEIVHVHHTSLLYQFNIFV